MKKNLTKKSEVEISLKNVVEHIFEEVDFERLLESVNEDNLHGLINFGTPRGKEVW